MLNLHAIDWLIIGLYVALAVGVGMAFKRRAGRNRSSYFLAGRALPWWWVGASMAATTFAADTPLAVAGLIADKGLSGNWLWIPAVGVHAAVFILFAANWSRSGVMTDAELIRLRYSGGSAYALRWCRAGLQLIQNCVVLGWVLRAMVKVASPFFLWHEWFPGFMAGVEAVWPPGTALGNASEGMTILALLLVVGFYSTLGGMRGVVLTDLAQLSLALIGSTWLAVCAWKAVGGRSGLLDGLAGLYGPGHAYLDWFPTPGSGWLGAAGVGAAIFGLYVVVQSFSNMSADGGGYFMQRLNAANSPEAARRAALLFLVIHYMVRVWPWFIVGVAALVLIPLGQETESLNGAGALAATDREMAWPVLMAYLLGPGWLGIVLTSLLAAFMSTVDTHINWGASYLVNDVWLVLRPASSDREQMRVARCAVILFVLLAVVVSARIDTIAQAWKWMATLGSGAGPADAATVDLVARERIRRDRRHAGRIVGGNSVGAVYRCALRDAADLGRDGQPDGSGGRHALGAAHGAREAQAICRHGAAVWRLAVRPAKARQGSAAACRLLGSRGGRRFVAVIRRSPGLVHGLATRRRDRGCCGFGTAVPRHGPTGQVAGDEAGKSCPARFIAPI